VGDLFGAVKRRVCKALNDDASAEDDGTSEGCGAAPFGIAGWAGWCAAIKFWTADCAD
jgi:hypothetical protein